MTATHLPHALLACPRCDRAPLDNVDGAARCGGCSVDFPSLGGTPWLFAEPQSALAEWRGRLGFLLTALERERGRLAAAAEAKSLGEKTRRRLQMLAEAKERHRAELERLLAPLALETSATGYVTHLALRTRLPLDQGLTTYYGNLHRDWAWGADENAASLEIVVDRLGDHRPERVLVLGAGAGRLAYDLHESTSAEKTLALDFNPLLVWTAARIAAGETIELTEFPIAPIDAEHQAVQRQLAAPKPARDGLGFVVADAHRPPFAKDAFDVVLTPWLVDILPEPFDDLILRINALLADGGLWINFGSLSFHDANPALRYGPDECADIIAASGFDAPSMRDDTIPYMCSPASRHGRRERVLSWSARKIRAARKPPRHEALPDWLVRGRDPVPLTKSFETQAASTRIHAFLMSMIDGRRSLKDMAALCIEQKLMSPEEAEPALRSFLIRMYEDGRRGTSY